MDPGSFFFRFFFKLKMIAKTLEINWHEGQAIYSIDFSLDGLRYATAGADSSIRVIKKGYRQ